MCNTWNPNPFSDFSWLITHWQKSHPTSCNHKQFFIRSCTPIQKPCLYGSWYPFLDLVPAKSLIKSWDLDFLIVIDEVQPKRWFCILLMKNDTPELKMLKEIWSEIRCRASLIASHHQMHCGILFMPFTSCLDFFVSWDFNTVFYGWKNAVHNAKSFRVWQSTWNFARFLYFDALFWRF